MDLNKVLEQYKKGFRYAVKSEKIDGIDIYRINRLKDILMHHGWFTITEVPNILSHTVPWDVTLHYEELRDVGKIQNL